MEEVICETHFTLDMLSMYPCYDTCSKPIHGPKSSLT